MPKYSNAKKSVQSYKNNNYPDLQHYAFKIKILFFWGKFILQDLKSGHFQNVHFSKPFQ